MNSRLSSCSIHLEAPAPIASAVDLETHERYQTLLGVVSAQAPTLVDVFTALNADGFAAFAAQNMEHTTRHETVARLVLSFAHQQKHNSEDFNGSWMMLKKCSETLGVELKSILVAELNKNGLDNFTAQTALQVVRALQWDPDFLNEPMIDALMKQANHSEAQEVLSHIPQECIGARNGSMLYKALRSYSIEERARPQSISALLQYIDPMKCVKPRFQDVSPDERILVTATLVPFLANAQQAQLLTLLESSLNRTKNKSPLQRMYESDLPKAQEFVTLWDKFKTRQKTKQEAVSTKSSFKHKV